MNCSTISAGVMTTDPRALDPGTNSSAIRSFRLRPGAPVSAQPPSRRLVTSAAIGQRSDRVRVMWAKSGWPLRASITETTPSWRPTRRLSRWATSWVSTTRLPAPEAAEGGEEHAALEVLGLVDDHEAVGEAAAPDVGEREHLEQVALEHLFDHLAAHDRLEGVDDGGRPRAHLLALAARAGSRGPGRRPRRAAGTPRPACGCAARARPPARRRGRGRSCRCRRCRPRLTMPISGSASRSMATRCSAERPRTSNMERSGRTRWSALVGVHPSQRRLRARGAAPARCGTGGRGRRRGRRTRSLVQLVDARRRRRRASTKPVQLRVAGQLVAVLLGGQADDARLQPQRQVLGDDDDVVRPRWPGCGRRRGCGGRWRRPAARRAGRRCRRG